MNFLLSARRRGGFPRVGRFAGYLLQGGAVIAAVALLATCAHSPSVLGRIQQRGTLVLATPNSPTTYYQGAFGDAGPAYDLARRFARELGVRLKVKQVANGHAALEAVADGRADIAAPGVAAASGERRDLRFTPPYQRVSSLLVYRAGEAVPNGIKDLADPTFKLTVAPSFAPLMRRLARTHPDIHWQASARHGSDALLIGVAQGKVAYTVVNENTFKLDHRFYPSLRAAFPLGAPLPIAWALRRDSDSSLYQAVVAFFARAKSDHFVADVLERYYGGKIAYNRVGTLAFLKDVGKRLPRYSANFERAARATGFSWQLLAAIGYQESHWNPNAVSPTGVRGLMMLTTSTAHAFGIHDRRDPQLSIVGAARYLAEISNRLPASIPQPDRQWMTLAAYNIGYGHLMDARRLAARHDGNPNSWTEVEKWLPRLNERRYYRHTRYGYANGLQAAEYVANIRNYDNILAWRIAQNTLPTQVTDSLKPDSVATTAPAE
ncbi:MAG: membrane-bound lytic murein transglycosylase MltF [Gammaproteobacteria bacterium]